MGKVNIKKMAQSQQATFIVCIDLNQTCLTDSVKTSNILARIPTVFTRFVRVQISAKAKKVQWDS